MKLSTLGLAILAGATAGGAEVKLSDFGFDKEDSTKFIQKAIDSGASKIIVDKRAEGPWVATTLHGRSNLELVFEDGAELVAKRGAFKGRTEVLFGFGNASNVVLRGKGTIRMWRSDYQQPPYEPAEWRHALSFGACRDVRIEDLSIVESGGDGIYISVGTPKAGFKRHCENVVVRNVKCLRNHRQGISVIAVDGLLIEGCELSDTCGTSPQAGIDFEPNVPADTIAHCVMRNCVLERNKGYGVDTLFTWHDETTAPLDITIENCISRDNEQAFHYNGLAQNGNLRTNCGRIVVTNCIAREIGGKDAPYSCVVEWGKRILLPNGAQLRPLELKDWSAEKIAITDNHPGEMVKLEQIRMRLKARYFLYAAQAGEIKFSAMQLVVGDPKKVKPVTTPMKLLNLKGEKLAELPAPASTSTVYVVKVPARGIYQLNWDGGWPASIIMDRSAVPVALSMFAERGKLGQWMAPFMYGRDHVTAYFAVPLDTPKFVAAGSGMGGGMGQSARVRITDPAGIVMYEKDDVGYADAYVSPDKPDEGLWKIEVMRPTKKSFNNYGFDVCGVPPLFFLSKEKYWTSIK